MFQRPRHSIGGLDGVWGQDRKRRFTANLVFTEAAMLGGLLGSSPLQPCQHKRRAGQNNHPHQNQRHQRSPRQSRDDQLQARIASDQAEKAVCGRFPQHQTCGLAARHSVQLFRSEFDRGHVSSSLPLDNVQVAPRAVLVSSKS